MRPLEQPTAEDTIEIGAPPERVWALIADVTRTPEWSPVCHRCEWVGDEREARVGARFRGHNRLNGARWSRECVVTEAEAGSVLSFSTTFKGAESTRWRYRLEPVGDSGGGGGGTGVRTRLTESYEIVTMPRWVRALRRLPGALAKSERDTARNLRTSLERIQAITEADESRGPGSSVRS